MRKGERERRNGKCSCIQRNSLPKTPKCCYDKVQFENQQIEKRNVIIVWAFGTRVNNIWYSVKTERKDMIYIDFCSFWQHEYFDELYFFGLSGFNWDVILNQFSILQRIERKTHQQHFTADNTNNTHRSRLIWQTVFICAWVYKPFHLPFKLHKNIVFAILMREFGRCSVCHSQVVSYQFSIKPTFLFVSWCTQGVRGSIQCACHLERKFRLLTWIELMVRVRYFCFGSCSVENVFEVHEKFFDGLRLR